MCFLKWLSPMEDANNAQVRSSVLKDTGTFNKYVTHTLYTLPADVNLSLDELVKQVLCDEHLSSRGAYNTEYVSLSVSSIAESESPVYHKMQPPSAQRINQLPRVSPRNYTPKIQPPPSSKSPAKKQVRKGKKGPLANTKRKQSSKNNRQVCARCQTTQMSR